VSPTVGRAALKGAGIHAVGLANNVNYGDDEINGSIAELDAAGIAHTGAGSNLEAARQPAIVERKGLRVGFLQRTSVYWPTHHEARVNTPGVAVIRGETAYQVRMHKTQPDIPPLNRPGIPPKIVTWAHPTYLKAFQDDIRALKRKTGFVVASCHWGLWKDVLEYMTEIAHAAIDAGADVVMGHGPHDSLAVELYQGKPIYYGIGSFSFHTGHNGRKHGNWVGMMPRLSIGDNGAIERASFQFVRHNDQNETLLCSMADERATFDDLVKRSAAFDTTLEIQGDEAVFVLQGR
jgi:poly-gamma-glutamate synthesis protein (capsule biosynthesis protein)